MSDINKELINGILNNLSTQTKARKPKRLGSSLSKRIQSLGELYKEIYYSLDESLERLSEIDKFDNLRISQYKAAIQSAKRMTDPAERSEALSRAYRHVFNDIVSALGLKDAKEIEDLTIEQQLMLSAYFGQRYFGT